MRASTRSGPSDEWRPLFFRIVQNKIRDCYRRRRSHGKVFALFGAGRNDDGEPLPDAGELAPAPVTDQPETRSEMATAGAAVSEALKALPPRQREAFLLRSYEGLSVAETAAAMDCSEGSVKTHHSRAVARLREQLGTDWT